MKKKVKCLICGEIFEDGLERCPVCGVGPEHFVAVQDEKAAMVRDTDDTYVILGGGVAAVSAAEAVRERDRTGTILMVSNEDVLPYNRPMLTKMMMESCEPSSIAIHPQSWYEEKNIIVLLSKTVDRLDPSEKKVWLDDGTWLKYDKCIYALGAECFVPDYEGKDLNGVMTIRKTADVQKIRGLLSEAKRAAVIGAGVLGLEAAWELKRSGCDVTLIGHSDQIMGKQLDRDGSQFMKKVIGLAGIALELGRSIEGLEGKEGVVTGVRLADGTIVPADIVIISTGVRPNLKPVRSAELSISRAICVDETMKTSEEDIYACGDCAEFAGVNYSIWPEASAQGKVAGANAAGEPLVYENRPAGVSFSGMGIKLYSIGDFGKNPQQEYRVVSHQSLEQMKYKKYWYVNDNLVGAILIGDVDDALSVMEAVGGR